jgi:Uma2 family endonuclease
MTAAEFAQLPESNKIIELINGEVVVAPSPLNKHQKQLHRLTIALGNKVEIGEWLFAPMDVHLDELNVVQPDLFWVSPDNTNCQLIDEYWYGPPDLVIEVLSPGTTRRDRLTKYDLYEKHGVREYWIVDADELYIEVYANRNSKFERVGAFGLGESFISPVLNGITLSVDVLLKP